MLGQCHLLRSAVTCPLLWTNLNPVSSVLADSDVTLRNRTVTAICTWHILKFVERVGAMEVDSELEWHYLLRIMCMPEVACRIEVEEMPDTKAVHVWSG